MATQVIPRRRLPVRRKKKMPRRWMAWWPLLLAVAVTPFAVKAAEIMPLMGSAGLLRLRLLYPLPLLAQRLPANWPVPAEAFSQSLMYLQFPLYALLLILVQRLRSLPAAGTTVLVLHLVAAAAVWLLPSH